MLVLLYHWELYIFCRKDLSVCVVWVWERDIVFIVHYLIYYLEKIHTTHRKQMCMIKPGTESTIRIFYVVEWSKCKGIETGDLWYIQRCSWPTGDEFLEKHWRIYRNHYARMEYREGELNAFSSLWNILF